MQEIEKTNEAIEDAFASDRDNYKKIAKDVEGNLETLKTISEDLKFVNKFIHLYKKKFPQKSETNEL